ncbi:2Fe-2S iron-sulfur cluster-binding protein [Amycolatopsis jejuensis]|uniref:2Fe-2S iron-sulfur cluster-binding protein n=1 Tax=Amycolatopsis jejuensis TaxID=330084 RepID=UPI000527C1E2|nr:2Fe-2S iron-sulfur cluster binding domain-containing protein [Amycolatopsis jejuensis]
MTIGHQVLLRGTGVRFPCAEGDTLLRAALRAGVGLSYECNSGACGSCRYELLEGEVRTRWTEAPGLSARDRRKGRRLACQSEPVTDCVVDLSAVPEPAPHRPIRQAAQLREVRHLTHDMAEFVFTAEKHAAFSAGQYAMLALPGGVERAYSMSNLGNCSREWKFVVKRSPDGQATSILFDSMDLGAAIELDGPYGQAYFRAGDDRDIVCVAGGSGLGAMVSVVLGAAAQADASERTVHLFCGGRAPRDLHIPEAMAMAERRLRALHVHTAVSEPGAADSGSHQGFVHEAVVAELGDEVPEFTYYAAGPPAMTDALARALVLDGGLAADRLHFDRFS